jgi:hypothetical protein
MKLKLAFLLALISSAGLIAADAPKPDAPKGDAPKGEGKKPGKKGPQKPEAVSEDDWKKFLAASEKAKEDPAVKAAEEKMKADPKDADARKALMEARKAAILKADASLDGVLKALEEARGKGKGKGDKKGEGKKPEAK